MNANLRAALLKQVRNWHWVSAAFCLVSLFLFALTGFFLNHSDWLKTEPRVTEGSVEIVATDLAALPQSIEAETLTPEFQAFLETTTNNSLDGARIEWDAEEVYIDIKAAGKTAWISVLPEGGVVEFEVTNYGTLAWFKDLHTGRNTGNAWRLYIDLFAVMCIIFTLTGLFLLMFYQTQRKSTWAVVSTGILLPLVIMLVFMHI